MDASGLTPEAAVDPPTSLRIAARNVNLIERWNSDHDAIVKEVLELGRRHAPLARAILEQPGSSWWFGPPDLDQQLWVNYSWTSYENTPPDPANWPVPSTPPTPWERKAQKPLGKKFTSTLIGGASSLLMALDERSGDYYCTFPVACWLLQAPPTARIFEVDGPQAWHNLCVRYPATWPAEQMGDGRLVPDWEAAAADWDAVHLSFGGLLTCEQVRVESPEGWSQHEFWHAEQTFWLRWLFTDSQRLPDHDRSPSSDWLRFPRLEAGRSTGVLLMKADTPTHRREDKIEEPPESKC